MEVSLWRSPEDIQADEIRGEKMIPSAPVNTVIRACPEGTCFEVLDDRCMHTVAECALMIACANDCMITVRSGDCEYEIYPHYRVDDVLTVLNCPSDSVICVRSDGSYLVARSGCLRTVAVQAIETAKCIVGRQQIEVNFGHAFRAITAECAVGDVVQSLERLQQEPLRAVA